MRTIELIVDGMTCAGCETAVGRALGRVAGVARASADAARGRAVVEVAEIAGGGAVDPQALAAAVRAAGFGARPAG